LCVFGIVLLCRSFALQLIAQIKRGLQGLWTGRRTDSIRRTNGRPKKVH